MSRLRRDVPRHVRPADQRRACATSAAASCISATTTAKRHHRARLEVYDAQTAPLLRLLSRARLAARGRRRGSRDDVLARVLRRVVDRRHDRAEDPEEIEIMRAASLIIAEVLAELRGEGAPGGHHGRSRSRCRGADARDAARVRPSRATWWPVACFPRTVCISINDEVVHGIPSRAACLSEGRHHRPRLRRAVIGLLRRLRGDGAGRTVEREARAPDAATEEALWAGIEEARPGRASATVGRGPGARRSAGFSVVRDFVGHGIGRRCTRTRRCRTSASGDGRSPAEGMVLAIEPMVNAGRPRCVSRTTAGQR